MDKFTDIVKRENKSTFKTLLIIIASVIFIDFIIFICNNYVDRWPYLTNILVILLIVIICSLIILRLFSKYSYTLVGQELIFHRVIGKKIFEMLRFNLEDLVYIKPYKKGKKLKKPLYKFVFPKEYENAYMGKFTKDDTYCYFIFKPSNKMIKLINKKLSKKE